MYAFLTRVCTFISFFSFEKIHPYHNKVTISRKLYTIYSISSTNFLSYKGDIRNEVVGTQLRGDNRLLHRVNWT
jgi:hypothetical protein